MIQRVRLYDRNAGSHVQSLVRELDPASMPQLKVLHAAVKTWNSLNQIKSLKKKKRFGKKYVFYKKHNLQGYKNNVCESTFLMRI